MVEYLFDIIYDHSLTVNHYEVKITSTATPGHLSKHEFVQYSKYANKLYRGLSITVEPLCIKKMVSNSLYINFIVKMNLGF